MNPILGMVNLDESRSFVMADIPGLIEGASEGGQLVCILPAAWFFAAEFGLHAVWYAFPLAEIISVVLTTVLFRRIYQKKIQLL